MVEVVNFVEVVVGVDCGLEIIFCDVVECVEVFG